jgi:hypothetical protein
MPPNLQNVTEKFTSPPKEGRCAEDYFALKNLKATAGYEPANFGTKGQPATLRPPKPQNNPYNV